jgi:hypothetical protein
MPRTRFAFDVIVRHGATGLEAKRVVFAADAVKARDRAIAGARLAFMSSIPKGDELEVVSCERRDDRSLPTTASGHSRAPRR